MELQINKYMKPTRAGGKSGVTLEMVRALSKANRIELLHVLNTWWRSKRLPDPQLLARVVSIFKKGDSQDIANYRPISLLQTFFKLFAPLATHSSRIKLRYNF